MIIPFLRVLQTEISMRAIYSGGVLRIRDMSPVISTARVNRWRDGAGEKIVGTFYGWRRVRDSVWFLL